MQGHVTSSRFLEYWPAPEQTRLQIPGDPGVTIGYRYRRLAELMLPLGARPSSFGQIQMSGRGEAVGVNGKTVSVTGTTSGIGEATACAYATAGANIVITGRAVQRGHPPARSLSRDGRQPGFARADLAKLEDVERLAADLGPARTPGSEPMGDELDELAAKLPLGRRATPDEIAAAALFDGPDEASSVNGARRAVDGGRTAI